MAVTQNLNILYSAWIRLWEEKMYDSYSEVAKECSSHDFF